jgi:hypothetical protein
MTGLLPPYICCFEMDGPQTFSKRFARNHSKYHRNLIRSNDVHYDLEIMTQYLFAVLATCGVSAALATADAGSRLPYFDPSHVLCRVPPHRAHCARGTAPRVISVQAIRVL